jgi:hypothetical protein
MDVLDLLARHLRRYIIAMEPDPEIRALCLAQLELEIVRARAAGFEYTNAPRQGAIRQSCADEVSGKLTYDRHMLGGVLKER